MKNIMKLFLYAALPLALIALGSCSYPKNITFKADSQTGALSGLYLTSDTSMNWILRTDGTQYEWVDSRYGWGLGHLRINGTEYSWNIPTKKHDTSHHMTVKYQTGDIEINVARKWNRDGNLVESYEFVNTGEKDADLQDIAINTPFNDNYPDARTCYEARCNAHIWAGGNEAYVYCTRMSGAPGGLGLIMEEGAIKGYEVRERSQKKGSSNFRGVFQLNPQDKTLNPGECYTIQWLLLSADNWDEFQAKAIDNGLIIASADRYVVEAGEKINVSFKSNCPSLKGKLLLNGKEVAEVSGDNITYTTTINEPGEKIFTLAYGNGKQTSVECLAVSNFDSLVNHRCQFIAGHQQFIKPGDPRSGAFIVYDNDTESLYINGESGSKRSDCDEARERVAMGP